MDFDPLSFFEPEPKIAIQNTDNENVGKLHNNDITEVGGNSSETSEETGARKNEDCASGEKDGTVRLQVLDLPIVNTSLPAGVLSTLLKLFEPDQTKNFGPASQATLPTSAQMTMLELEKYLSCKRITTLQLEELSNFLKRNIQSTLTLTYLPKQDHTGITSFLTKVISFPFLNYTEEERDSIYNLASHVMTANSSPALKGDTTRVVEIEGLSKDILLYEPALTEDKIGNITWGASLELAKQIVKDKTSVWLPKPAAAMMTPILELGAGTGLVTIVLGLLGYRVVSTDLPEIVDNLTRNIELNQLEFVKSSPAEKIVTDSLVHVTSLDWRAPNEFLDRTMCLNGYETVLLSDPVYSTSHPYWVRDAVSAVLSQSENAHVVFMVGRRDRFEDVRECLWQFISDLGLKLILSRIVDGYDDYGVLQYDYKVYGRKDQ